MLAIGKRGYYFAAHNLAFSIKHFNPDANILLLHDGNTKYIPTEYFDILHEVDLTFTHQRGVFDAGGAKLGIYSIATQYFKEFMYLDVDALCIKSLKPFYDSMTKDFHIEVEGKGGINDTIEYSVWAENKDIWEEFGLAPDATYYAVQSSWFYAKKTRQNTALFKDALKMNRETFTDRRKLKVKWGMGLPDELILGGAISKRNIDPSHHIEPIFFGHTHVPLKDVTDNYYILSLYGNGDGKTMTKLDYLEFYDRWMLNNLRKQGLNHHYKVNLIMKDKLINR